MGILLNIVTTCIRTSDGRREQTTPCRRRSHFCLVPINKCLFSPAPSDQRRGTDVSSKLQEILRRGTNISHKLQEILRRGTNISHKLQEILRRGTNISRKLQEILRRGTNISHKLQEILRRDTNISRKLQEAFGGLRRFPADCRRLP